MEAEIKNLSLKTIELETKCESLEKINKSLLEKNAKLDKELEMLRLEFQQQTRQQKHNSNLTSVEDENSAIGSAVSTITDPLQQGLNRKCLYSTQMLNDVNCSKLTAQIPNKNYMLQVMVPFYAIFVSSISTLLKRHSMTPNSMPANWRNLPNNCLPISPEIWTTVLQQAMNPSSKKTAKQTHSSNQWWGPQQNAWNPVNRITMQSPTVV